MLTYKKAGVDIDKANILVKKIKALAKSTKSLNVLEDMGAFGSLFKFDAKKYKNPVLVSSTDGVGTKLKIAFLADKHDTVGIDLVAMNVNDVLATGARPLFFLDYISTGKLNSRTYLGVIKGIVNGCKQADCVLIGGETAEMPGMYRENEYDLAGFCVGVVERDKIIDGKKIKVGDMVLGLASSGPHSNGFSLVRKVFSISQQKRLAKTLLTPTRIYVKPVLSLLSTIDYRPSTIKGIAHITGGAFYDKIARILPGNVNVRINKNAWNVPRIFRLIQQKGNVPQKDMYRTFNMGIGMVLVVDKKYAKNIQAELAKFKLRSWVIGEVVRGNKETIIV